MYLYSPSSLFMLNPLLNCIRVQQLKVLKVVTKNLADPTKARDDKYRQLKLDNEKIQQKLLPCQPHAVDYLYALGFCRVEDQLLRVVTTLSTVRVRGALQEVTAALEGLEGEGDNSNNKKPKYERQASSTVSSTSSEAPLTEKQKARRLLERKQREEKERTRRARKATAALIQQDRYVRAKDENWTSGPSAAVSKAGSAVSTFRDRHGEN